MIEVNVVAVLVATIVTMAVASIWYSPMLFGRTWMSLVGLSEEALKNEGKRMMYTLGFGFVVQFVMLLVLAEIFALVDAVGMRAVATASFAWLLVGLVMLSNTVWERKSLWYVAINMGYLFIVFIGSSYIITYWPW